MYRVFARVLAALIVLGGVWVPSQATAIIDGENSDVPWAVHLTMKKPDGTSSCSGSLIAPQWVLTAAHCVAELAQNDNDYTVMPAKKVTAYVGRTDPKSKGKKYKVDRIETRRYRRLVDPARTDDDVALLHLTKASTARPLWLMPLPEAAQEDVPVTLHGFGRTGPVNDSGYDGTSGTLRRTQPGANSLWLGCDAATDGQVCARDEADPYSLGGAGDSGGAWVVGVDGRDVQAFVFSGYTGEDSAGSVWQYGESVFGSLTAEWIRGYIDLPDPVPGRIIRNPETAESWLTDAQGYLRSIPDGGVYECLVAQGSEVLNLAGTTISLMPTRDAEAKCGGGDVFLFELEVDRDDASAVGEVLEAKGYAVTTGTTLPNNLDSFGQVWVFSTFNGYPADVQAALADYTLAGGSVLFNGEHECCSQTNTDAETIMDSVLTTNVSLVTACPDCIKGSEPVLSGAYGGISDSPNASVTLLTDAAGWMSEVPVENRLVEHAGYTIASVWGPPHTKSGSGRMVVIMDSNWTDRGNLPGDNSDFAENVAAYLGG